MSRPLSPIDHAALARARTLLENPGLAARLTDVLGTPIEKGFALLPADWNRRIQAATNAALQKALGAALGTMNPRGTEPARRGWHKVAVAASGALGGALGLPALVLELPVSTTVMLRSIAEIARAEGEDLDALEARLACLEVFALGGRSRDDDAAESGYFVVRAALAKAVSEAAEYVARRGVTEEAAPALVRLVTTLGARFGVVVSEKAAAIAIPVLGAAGGAAVNALFLDHFQKMAWGHFTVRRLERAYGREVVRAAWEEG